MPTLVAADKLYSDYVNPQWTRLLDVLQMNVSFTRCEGVELWRADGKRVLDFLSGYCVHNAGHNHPSIVAALKDELDRRGPVMLQSNVPELAGELASRLCRSAAGRLKKAHFTSSGSEGVETAIKFARAHTRRSGLLFAEGAFHGLTCGALSLMGNEFWREGFGPLLPDARQVPFGDLQRLAAESRDQEPRGVHRGDHSGRGRYSYSDGRLFTARPGTLPEVWKPVRSGRGADGNVSDGPLLAAHHFGLDPDMVILAKALSGGLVPVGAVLLTDAVYDSVYSSLKRAIIHTSTYSENNLAMRAGLATLDVLESQGLGERSRTLGQYLVHRLNAALAGYEMVKSVRGVGLFCGVEFQAPRSFALRASFETFMRIHPGMFGQMLVMQLFREKGILTQICGNNFLVLKVAPPLVVVQEQIDEFVTRLREVVESIHSSATFWTAALGLARRVTNI